MPTGFGLIQLPSSNGLNLLISCSSKKKQVDWQLPAREIYRGTLLRTAIKFAETHGFHPYILSAKYGFIEIDKMLPYYDQKMTEPYQGEYPPGKGFYVGSQLYFGNAPPCYHRLIPTGLGIGLQMQWLKRRIGDFVLSDYWKD